MKFDILLVELLHVDSSQMSLHYFRQLSETNFRQSFFRGILSGLIQSNRQFKDIPRSMLSVRGQNSRKILSYCFFFE